MESLKRIDGYRGPRGPVVLVIMDGVGIGRGDEGDARRFDRRAVVVVGDRQRVFQQPGARLGDVEHAAAFRD